MFRQRRSLGKGISQSRRVNKLSDQGALLYTWMIHSYDDDGRMPGDPEDLRYNVFPRRNVTTDQVIENLLTMNELELIRWYLVDGTPYIEMDPEAWKEHQTFKGIKRIPSKIPTYDPKKHLRYVDHMRNQPSQVDDSTLEGVPLHPEGCDTTPDTVDDSTKSDPKLSEVKLREVKSLSYDKQPAAASSSQHFSDKIESTYLQDLLDLAKKIQAKSNGKKAFNFYQWIQHNIKKKSHPGAMIKVGNGIYKLWEDIKDPWAYAETAMTIENGNANEQDRAQEYKKVKAEWKAWEQTPAAQKLSKMLNLKHVEAP